MKKLTVALSGASGIELGWKLIEAIPKEIELFVVATEGAFVVAQREGVGRDFRALEDSDIGACIASGSFGCDAMAIVPCSLNTLAKITHGIADNLTTRAASVMLKEQKRLLLAPREMPFGAIMLENMLKLSRLGVMISPPVAGYYAGIETLEMMEDFWVGKWLDGLGIAHELYQRWK
ncbi:MAG: UbiX family flavin prenyltransferase [Wolinella succinogenes]|uniref:UbiX family flavin prenyltransferase n=1 Tax=Wolinella succinogenes TaxID=844 RepID=UPI0016B692F4|nr:UbiX family flavin prenyltransferase [Wolinella succinogenes]NLU33380.1 UbiX family flavin prenyltransferase [Wolinella succinogenes]